MNQFTFIDLFSGIGGFRLALEENGGECVFSSEIDKYAQETYYNNFGDVPSGDITEVEAGDIPNHDVLCAGFPCQPFSLAGKRMGFEDTRGTLFFEIERIVKEKRPKILLLENVAGIVSHDKGNTLQVIEHRLEALNYFFEWRLINAKEYGVPQNRNRWYLIALNKDFYNEGEVDFEQVFPQKQDLQLQLDHIIQKEVPSEYNASETAMKNIENNINDFIESDRYTDEHYTIANNIRPSRVSFSSTGISPCLTAKMGTGGNNVPVVYELGRKFTVRECLNLMGFPETYKMKENYSQSYKQVGNSVVVPIISSLASGFNSLL